MKHNDWIPGREQDLVDLMEVWLAKFEDTANLSKYGWNQADVMEVKILMEQFINRRRQFRENPTEQNRIRKDDTKHEAIAAMRKFANTSIRFNRRMEDGDRKPFGIGPKDTEPTPIARPAGLPHAEVVYEGPGLIALHLDHLEGTPEDEKADYGIKIAWGFMPPGGATMEQAAGHEHLFMEPPTHGEHLPHSYFTKRQRHHFDFTQYRGYKVFLSLRYENDKGEPGPYCPVFDAIIP